MQPFADATKIAAAIVVHGLLVSAAVAWHGRGAGAPLERSASSRLGSSAPSERQQPPRDVAPAAKAVDPLAGVLTTVEFARSWGAGPAATAEARCFEPARRRGPYDPTPYFRVHVDATGGVTDVSWEPTRPGQGGDEMLRCIGDVIRAMRLPPRDAPAVGEVQAARPGAFVISSDIVDAGAEPRR
jgi:hypothetical protein